MSLNAKNQEKKKFSQRLNSIENNISKRRKKNKNFINIDKNFNSFISSKNFDILKYQKLSFFKRKKNYFNYEKKRIKETPLSFDKRNIEEKNKLIKEISLSFNELKLQDKEMKKYKELYGSIKEQNKTNQYILDQLMNEEKENKVKREKIKIDNYEKMDENNKSKQENDILISDKKKEDQQIYEDQSGKVDSLSNREKEKQDFFLTKTFLLNPTKNDLFSRTSKGNFIKNGLLPQKNKKRKQFLNDNRDKKNLSQINFLKRELIIYNKAIDKDGKKLEDLKKKKNISNYIKAKNELELQNKELEDLIKLYNEYHKKINEFNIVISFFRIKNENYISLINEINRKIEKKFNSKNEAFEKDIPQMESDKKAYEEQITLFKPEMEKIKKEIDENKMKEQSLNEFIDNNLKFWNEKNKNNIEINNTYILEQKLKRKLELKNDKLEKAKIINSELKEFIKQSTTNKKSKIEEKTKYEQIELEHINKIKKEIDEINKEIQKLNYRNDVEENELEMEINKQNIILKEQQNELEQLNKEEKYLNEQISELKSRLK